MTDCKGLFGKIFGHDFDQFLVKSEPVIDVDLSLTNRLDIVEILEALHKKEWELRCKRCGAKPYEGK